MKPKAHSRASSRIIACVLFRPSAITSQLIELMIKGSLETLQRQARGGCHARFMRRQPRSLWVHGAPPDELAHGSFAVKVRQIQVHVQEVSLALTRPKPVVITQELVRASSSTCCTATSTAASQTSSSLLYLKSRGWRR